MMRIHSYPHEFSSLWYQRDPICRPSTSALEFPLLTYDLYSPCNDARCRSDCLIGIWHSCFHKRRRIFYETRPEHFLRWENVLTDLLLWASDIELPHRLQTVEVKRRRLHDSITDQVIWLSWSQLNGTLTHWIFVARHGLSIVHITPHLDVYFTRYNSVLQSVELYWMISMTKFVHRVLSW